MAGVSVHPLALATEVETDGSSFLGADGRWAYVKIGGFVVFRDFVYDTDSRGQRTEDMARANILLLFTSRLRRLLEDS